MSPYLASFSDWVLALLPRLFLYPGGLWLLALTLVHRFARGGPQSVAPVAIARELTGANLLPLAIAWAGVALSPLPGVSPLPLQPDRFSLAALWVLSVGLAWHGAAPEGWGQEEAWATAGMTGITLAIMAPVAAQPALLFTGSNTPSDWLSLLAVLAGLGALSVGALSGVSIASVVLALGLGLAPLWSTEGLIPMHGLPLASAVCIPVIAGFGALERWGFARKHRRMLVVTCWALAALSLLAALLPR